MSTDDEARRILADPGTSPWLHHALRTALQYDVVDVIRDCERLLYFLGRRQEEFQKKPSRER